jgi:hypothetical protein
MSHLKVPLGVPLQIPRLHREPESPPVQARESGHLTLTERKFNNRASATARETATTGGEKLECATLFNGRTARETARETATTGGEATLFNGKGLIQQRLFTLLGNEHRNDPQNKVLLELMQAGERGILHSSYRAGLPEDLRHEGLGCVQNASSWGLCREHGVETVKLYVAGLLVLRAPL